MRKDYSYIGTNIGTKGDVLLQSASAMEPLMPPEGQAELEDPALILAEKASALAGQTHPIVARALGDLVRSMNCYYSNLIEGHNTHPRDIDRAMRGDYSQNKEKRNLQLEAKAHIDVQKLIDEDQAPQDITSATFLTWTHHAFCSRLPDELLWVENPDTGERIKVIPGELRQRDVVVGQHVPPPPQDLDRFLERFDEAYNPTRLSRLRQIIAIGASHHRILWIHPFLDGNGRVARLMAHAYLKRIGIGSALWSVSRGLARRATDYKAYLMKADEPRRGDLNGRGNLTQSALIDFCQFFLDVCIDQVEYMAGLLEPAELLGRMELHINEEIHARRLPKGSFQLLREAVLAGEFRRGEAANITGYQDRQARKVLGKLIEEGYLVSDAPKGPVRIGLPQDAVERWFPQLYPVSS